MSGNSEILEQQLKFNAELPALMQKYQGQWIVYLNEVRHVTSEERLAIQWGYEHIGIDVPFIVDQVVPHEPIPAWRLGGMGAAAVYSQEVSTLKEKNDSLREALTAALYEMQHVLGAPVGSTRLTPQQVMDLERGIKIAREALGK